MTKQMGRSPWDALKMNVFLFIYRFALVHPFVAINYSALKQGGTTKSKKKRIAQ
jgi:hypothetical protein